MLRLLPLVLTFATLSCLKGSHSSPQAVGEVSSPENKGTNLVETPAGVPEIEPDNIMFAREYNQLKLLPLALRTLKIEQWLVDDKLGASARAQIAGNPELGGQNFNEGKPEFSLWSVDSIEKWLSAVGPFCQDPSVVARYETSGVKQIFEDIYGRSASAEEIDDFAALNSDPGLSAQEKFTVQCVSLLSSLEFATL